MSSDKPIHVLVTVTKDGESKSYEKWANKEEAKKILSYDKPTPTRYAPQGGL